MHIKRLQRGTQKTGTKKTSAQQATAVSQHVVLRTQKVKEMSELLAEEWGLKEMTRDKERGTRLLERLQRFTSQKKTSSD